MSNIYKSVSQLIGKTPILELNNIKKNHNTNANLFAKLECFNPAGSAKDRVALSIINDAEKNGIIKKDTLIIEPTSGNTGIGLAAVAASRGYKTVIVMPDTMSMERRLLMKAYGAELILSDGSLGMTGAIAKAEEIQKENPNSFIAGQFTNPANPKAHFETTGPEIYEDMGGEVDVFVAGVGTGGTITGVGEYLKSKNPNVKIIAAEPDTSAVLSGEKPGAHGLQGIGAGFVPEILNTGIYDEIIKVSKEDAYNLSREMGTCEGVLVGISSGAALFAALEVAQREEYKGKNIVVLMPDSGERYLSTDLYK
ncbi:MAG: cysteine synthase A [Clostridia bacterium]|nr:cysteine synthase A [Clostridia bacterium]